MGDADFKIQGKKQLIGAPQCCIIFVCGCCFCHKLILHETPGHENASGSFLY